MKTNQTMYSVRLWLARLFFPTPLSLADALAGIGGVRTIPALLELHRDALHAYRSGKGPKGCSMQELTTKVLHILRDHPEHVVIELIMTEWDAPRGKDNAESLLREYKSPLVVDAMLSVAERNPDDYVAIRVLRAHPDARAVPAMVKALTSSSRPNRNNAVLALEEIADESAVPSLIECLHPENPVNTRYFSDDDIADYTGRISILKAIARTKSKVAVQPLCRLLTATASVPGMADLSFHVTYLDNLRAACVDALASIGDASCTPVLIDALKETGARRWHGNSFVHSRIRAARALGALSTPEVLRALKEVSSSEQDEQVRKTCRELIPRTAQTADHTPEQLNATGIGILNEPHGDTSEAARLFIRAAELDPTNPKYVMNAGVAHQMAASRWYAHIGDGPLIPICIFQSDKDLGRAIDRHHGVLETVSSDNVLFLRGEVNEALRCYEKALSMNVQYSTARAWQAQLLRNIGAFSEALVAIEKLLGTGGTPESERSLGNELKDYILGPGSELRKYISASEAASLGLPAGITG